MKKDELLTLATSSMEDVQKAINQQKAMSKDIAGMIYHTERCLDRVKTIPNTENEQKELTNKLATLESQLSECHETINILSKWKF